MKVQSSFGIIYINRRFNLYMLYAVSAYAVHIFALSDSNRNLLFLKSGINTRLWINYIFINLIRISF